MPERRSLEACPYAMPLWNDDKKMATIGNEQSLIIDPGSRTFDWLVARGMRQVQKQSHSFNRGMSDVLRLIAADGQRPLLGKLRRRGHSLDVGYGFARSRQQKIDGRHQAQQNTRQAQPAKAPSTITRPASRAACGKGRASARC